MALVRSLDFTFRSPSSMDEGLTIQYTNFVHLQGGHCTTVRILIPDNGWQATCYCMALKQLPWMPR